MGTLSRNSTSPKPLKGPPGGATQAQPPGMGVYRLSPGVPTFQWGMGGPKIEWLGLERSQGWGSRAETKTQKEPLGEEMANPLSNPCLGNPMDRGAWQATVHGVANELDMT